MIYDVPEADAPIKQGDIFVGLPRIDISLKKILLFEEEGTFEASWNECAQRAKCLAVVPLKRVAAIVITQDCDAIRSPDISLCEIRPFRDVEKKSKDTKTTKSWVNMLTQQARLNYKWFYLPPNERIGWQEKQAADFRVTLRLPREDLEDLRTKRLACLNGVARAHFRERLSDFFRRFPYDEWYALDAEELGQYRKEYPEAEPFPWQSLPAQPDTEPGGAPPPTEKPGGNK